MLWAFRDSYDLQSTGSQQVSDLTLRTTAKKTKPSTTSGVIVTRERLSRPAKDPLRGSPFMLLRTWAARQLLQL